MSASNPNQALLRAMEGTRLLAIRGPNFSGRTDLLRRFCSPRNSGRVYLGPEVYNALSGLATTVRQEIELHAGAALESTALMGMVDEMLLIPLLEQHPATLSGGEQACVAVMCAAALRPGHLAIDCSLEQLDSHRLNRAITLLASESGPTIGALITDNRLDEWEPHPQLKTVDVGGLRTTSAKTPAALATALAAAEIEKIEKVVAPSIALKALGAGYKKRPGVLENVNLSLEPGKVYALEGPNGSGKSTWAKVLCGVVRADRGEILFDGKPVEPAEAPGKVVGYHLQNPDVALFESTVRAELYAGHSSKAEKIERIEHVIDAFGLRQLLAQNPLALPFPVRKRVSLAATIARDTPWVFIDEPTLGADAATITEMSKLVRRLAERGHGVIVVSHSRSFIGLVGDVHLSMQAGGIV